MTTSTTSSGRFYLELTVTDKTGKTNQEIIDIYTDSTAPILERLTGDVESSAPGDTQKPVKLVNSLNKTIGATDNVEQELSNTISQSDETFQMAGNANDGSGSGVSYVAFWFERQPKDSSGQKRVYNPMFNTSNRTELAEDEASATSGQVFVNSDGLAVLPVDVTRNSDETITLPAANDNIRRGGLVFIGGDYVSITKVEGREITLGSKVDIQFEKAYFVFAQIVDRIGKETSENYGEEDNVDYDGDGMLETLRTTGAWEAAINSSNIPDGSIIIHVTAIDGAGNVSWGTLKSKVANSRPRIVKVMVATDWDDDNKFTVSDDVTTINNTLDEERATESGKQFGEFVYYSTITRNLDKNGNPIGNAIVTVQAADGSIFIAPNAVCVIPEFAGGNGTLKYGYEITNNSTETQAGRTPVSGTYLLKRDISDSGLALQGANANSIVQTETKYGGLIIPKDVLKTHESWINETEKNVRYLSLTFWDQTEETTQGVDSLFALLKIPMYINCVDNIAPKINISPFHWKNNKDNSVYQKRQVSNKIVRIKGHIELEDDLSDGLKTSTFTAGTPKVSGQIIVRGTASDEMRLESLGIEVARVVSSTEVLTYSSSSGWLSKNTASDTAIVYASAKDVYANTKGHKAEFEIVIDTSKLNTVAGKNIAIKVYAKDRPDDDSGQNTSSASSTQTTSTSLTSCYYVDVVPYITAIHTTNRTASGLKDSNIRSASGKYSVIKGTTDDFITVEGYNLGTTRTVKIGTETVSSTGGTSSSFKITNNLTKSGLLEVTVNGMPSINNLNDNDARGVYELADDKVEDTPNMYNREPDLYNTKNIILNDDRYIRVFDMKKTPTKNGYHPKMIMDGDDPVFGLVDMNGVTGGTNPGSNELKAYFMPQRIKYTGTTGIASNYEYLCGATTWDQMGMAKDSAGKYVHASVYNRTGGALEFFYDKFASVVSNNGWALGITINNQDYTRTYSTNNNALTLDGMDYGSTLIDRYQNINMIAKGDSTTNAGTGIYMSYYDDQSHSILFRDFQIGSQKTTNPTRNIKLTAQYTNQAEINNKTSVASGRNIVTAAGSKYHALGVDGDNYVIIAYYDNDDSCLKLLKSTAAVDGSSPTTAVSFEAVPCGTLPLYVGQYVSMAIDDNDGIHIAAFDATDSDLAYIYVASKDATSYTHYTVDAASAVGKWTDIKIKNNKPYIAYTNSTEDGGREAIKMAWANTTIGNIKDGIEDGYTTGEWEYVTVPSIDPAQCGNQKFARVNIDFDSKGVPVVGYLGTNIEFGKEVGE